MTNIFRNFFKSHSVLILDKLWHPIKDIKVKHIPRYGEYIYLEEKKKYYVVLNVVYNIKKKQGIFIIVEEHGNDKPLT